MSLPEPVPRICYRDDQFIAVDKPAGMLVHRSALSRERTVLLQAVRDLAGKRVYPVHRIDRPTAGVVIFGLSSEAAARLTDCFRSHGVQKTYLTVVRGYLPDQGTVDHPVKNPDTGKRLDAQTSFRCLEQIEINAPVGRYPTARYSLAAAEPHTGRRHQLRRHFKHLFHPIIGDTIYGDGRHNRFFRDRFSLSRLLLCAAALAFTHPYTGEPVLILSGETDRFLNDCRTIGFSPDISTIIPPPSSAPL